VELQMPALSPTMTQGNIAKWAKKEGDAVAPGDALCDIETDKATMTWEAQEEGIVARILVPDGSADVPVGQVSSVPAPPSAHHAPLLAASSQPAALARHRTRRLTRAGGGGGRRS